MIWFFLAVVLVLLVYSPGFRRAIAWCAGGAAVVAVLLAVAWVTQPLAWFHHRAAVTDPYAAFSHPAPADPYAAFSTPVPPTPPEACRQQHEATPWQCDPHD